MRARGSQGLPSVLAEILPEHCDAHATPSVLSFRIQEDGILNAAYDANYNSAGINPMTDTLSNAVRISRPAHD